MVSGVRGSHIVVSHFPGAPGTAVYSQGIDGRPLYIVPWNDQILVGATHVADSADPAKVHPRAMKLSICCARWERCFRRRGISPNDIRHAFAGIRSVPFDAKGDLEHVGQHGCTTTSRKMLPD